jgi:hypothetical protein
LDSDKPRLEYQGAVEALNERGARVERPICGETGWGSVGSLGNLLATLPAITPHGEVVGTSDSLGGINAFVLTCRNCGFIRLHAEQVLSNDPTDGPAQLDS